MRVQILDSGALLSISPSALRGYATFEGWRSTESYGETSAVYIRKFGDNRFVEIIIPVTDQIGDYSSVVSQLISVFARESNRDELSVFRDLTQADRDVVRVRSTDADKDGAISIELGVELVRLSRDMLASAACAASEPRRAYHLGKVLLANQYMEKVKLGQTETGSFVITLLAPVPPTLGVGGQPDFWPELTSEPYERRVTRVLTQALDATRTALAETNRGRGESAFDAAIKDGVSANLCEAVAAIAEHGTGADVSIMWARTRPTPEASTKVWFSKDDGAILKEVARQFRLKEPRDDFNVVGIIERCTRTKKRASGSISIAALIDNRAQIVRVDLNAGEYEKAVEAHKKKNAVQITGELRRDGERWHLYNPREFFVITDSGDPKPDGN
jgi:hypothetical protein